MPHCIIEYAENIARKVPVTQLMDAVYKGALTSGLFGPADIKTRAVMFTDCRTENKAADFIHVTARILSGRTVEQRAALAQLILSDLTNLGLTAVSLTIEVVEMERSSYAKKVLT